ncbi:MAG: amino acid adenylation domain-containing protein [Gemmatimonadota bacterium]
MENVESVYALSPMQQDILLRTLQAPALHEYVELVTWTLRGPFRPAAFAAAWGRVAARHPALRTSFFHEGLEHPVQVVRRGVEIPVEAEDWRGVPAPEQEERFRALLRAERERDFDPAAAPLLRVRVLRTADDAYRFAWCYHHLLLDGWSAMACVREVLEAYAALAAGGEPPHSPAAPYADYVAWLARRDEAEAERFWRAALAGVEPPAPLPLEGAREADGAGYRVETATLPTETGDALRAASRRLQVSLNTLCEAAWGLLLARYTGADEAVFGAGAAGRPADLPGAEGMLGVLLRTVPVRVRPEPAARLGDWLAALQRARQEARLHDTAPLARIREWSGLPRGQRLFEHFFLFQNLPDVAVARAELGGAEISGFERVPPEGAYGNTLMLTVIPRGEVALELTHAASLDSADARRVLGRYRALLEAMAAADPSRRVGGLGLATSAERRRVLTDWNRTADGLAPGCAHREFEARAAREPGRVALVSGEERLTYAELDARANRLAHHLRARGAGPETRVALCLERTAEMVVAVLATLKAGAAYVPLDPAHPAERLAYVLEDSGAALVLTERHLAERLGDAVPRIELDSERAAVAARPASAPDVPVGPGNLAYVLYTSGSTGRPKGVLVEHGSFAGFIHAMRLRPGMAPDDVLLAVATLAFDIAGLDLFLPLTTGARVVLADRAAATDPRLLARALDEAGATVLQATPATWRMLLDGGWRGRPGLRALCGAEALTGELAERLLPRVAGLWNLYGPTETTVWCTAHRGEAVRGAAPIGRPVANARTYVLDPERNPAPPGLPGELYVGGTGVARGYHARPELTADRYVPDPFAAEPGARLYRTGDRVRWNLAGELEFIGRMDRQVKVRGFRIEPGEVEGTLARHPAVRQAAVVAWEHGPGEARLAGYVSLREAGTGPAELRDWLRGRLPEYMVPSALLVMDALPLTPSGKLDRRALPRPEAADGARGREFVEPRDHAERTLAGIWEGVLGVERVGARDDFFELGGHSLLAVRLAARVHEAFGVVVPLGAFFRAPTVEALARLVGGMRPDAAERIPRRADDGPAPLSSAQQRLWFLDRMAPGAAAYNVPGAVRLDGALDAAALEASVAALVRRHEALRTVFAAGDGGPVQVVLPTVAVPLESADLAGLPAEAREAEAARLLREAARRPFDLAAGPLLRALLVRVAPDRHLLMLVAHHVVTDGWSLRVMVRDLSALYAARVGGGEPSLPELPVRYADYAAWQRERLQGPVLRQQLDWWTARLAGAPPALELPADRPRPAVQSFDGARRRFRVPAATADALRRLGQREEATPFMVYLAAFCVLLSRLTGQEDVVVGTPVANRGRPETAGMVGFFANTLAMRADLAGDPTFVQALRAVREAALGAYEHEELPFERLVEELRPERDLSRTVVFQVAFSFDAGDTAAPEPPRLPGLELAPAEVDPGLSQFDLTLRLEPDADGVAGVAEYATALFDASTVARMLECWATLLDGIAAAADRRLSELPLLPQAERERVETWSVGPAAARPDGTVHGRVGARARLAPDAAAVESGGETLTYAELEARANRLAHHLRGLGVGPEARVGICLEPGPERVAAMLAVLRAGGAYLPLDPEYPAERLAWMLEDAGAPVLIVSGRTADRVSAAGVRGVVRLDVDAERIAAESADAPEVEVGPESLAYVVYTSGSTGRPKGVMVSHGALLNLAAWHARAFAVTPADRATQLASFSFDAAVWETWPYLLAGASLHPVDAETRASPEALRDLLLERGITLAFAPTALAEALLALDWPERTPLRALLTGGDALRVRPLPGLPFALVNDYGPTEAAVVATSGPVPPGGAERAPSIGRPIDGVHVRVLDPHGGPVPTGVAGELYVGGLGVARGYLGRPELTAERFVPDALSGEAGARAYRTGDRARWLPTGELEFLGRTDRQVKVRGFRIEPGEVEAALREQPGVRDAAVELRDGPGGKRLVGYVVPAEGGTLDAAEVRSGLRDRLPDHMVPAALVVLDRMPLTPAGKLDRAALPAPEREDSGEPAVLSTPTELLLADAWADVLGGGRPAPGGDVFALGGPPLRAARVVSRVRETLGVALPVRAVFEAPTLGELAGRVDALRAGGDAAREPILAVPRDRPLPVSPAQGRIWLQHHLSPAPESYNLGTALRLRGPLAPAALRSALVATVARHEALRTRFVEEGGEPVQVVEAPMPLPLPAIDLSRLSPADREAGVACHAAADQARPFDLERAPLVRGALLRLGADEHVLLVAAHHVVFDGWSAGVLTRELREHYAAALEGRAAALPPLEVQYGDYAARERRRIASPAFARKLEFWARELAGAPSAVELPVDGHRPPVQRFRGTTFGFRIDAPLAAEIGAMARREGATRFMALLAGFQALLHRYTGQDDLVVGTPVAGRDHPALEPLIGFFVNVLPVRARIGDGDDFRALLRGVRSATLDAYAHQEVSLEQVVDAAGIVREASRSPLVQVLFALQNTGPAAFSLPGLRAEVLEVQGRTARYELSVYLREEPDGALAALVELDTDLFARESVERWMRHYRRLLEAFAADPSLALADAPLLDEAERGRILRDWNRTAQPAESTGTVAELFAAQARRTPDAVALVAGSGSLTYADLAGRAAGIAADLSARGVGPESRVGILLERSPEMVAAMLGVLAAGAAYVPLDPAHPGERLAYMLADSGARVLLTQAGLAERAAEFGGEVVALDVDDASAAIQPPYSPGPPPPASGGKGENDTGALTPRPPLPMLGEGENDGAEESAAVAGCSLFPVPCSLSSAYVIYTSGSTGRPKGVVVEHRNVAAFFAAMTERVGGEPGTWLALTSIAFDISVLELLWTLTRGSTVVLHAGREREGGGASVAELVRAHGVTHVQCTPSHAALLAADPDTLRALAGVRCMLLGGEALPGALAGQLREATAARLLNMYGPTETTVWSAAHEIVDPGLTVPIGRPIAGTQVYVLDAWMQPVPPGVAGELLIGGAGVARGYLGRPELTATQFFPDPFSGAAGARLYRTGDLARWRADGVLEFLGRADRQVKVRGHRIEPGEVESALDAHPDVRESVVLADEGGGDGRLVAYFVPATGDAPPAAELRRHLAERLPEYMVPSLFVPLEHIPLTPNGKTDRDALAAAGASGIPAEAEYAPPRNATEAVISEVWREVLGVERVGVRDHFFELGGTSVRIAAVQRALTERLGRPVAVVDLFRYPTVADLAAHLGAREADRAAVQRGQERAEALRRGAAGDGATERIAVVGMAGRFPGAPDLDAFWRNLRGGVESIVPLTEEQVLAAGTEPDLLRRADFVRAGGTLEGAELFDAEFFDLTPRDAELLDPQHRLFLEQAWAALENAGCDPDTFPGPIGVFAGANMNTYLLAVLARRGPRAADLLQAKIRSDKDFLTTLASYKLNLRGPSYAVQTACSTSLVATHLACRSLLDRQCDVALAGGVSLTVPQEGGYLAVDGVMSRAGHCRAFDAAGDGSVVGNGVGVVVLKRLADALRDGDRVHAVILGSAVNNDGAAKVGYTAPSVEGQIEVIATAHAVAGIPAESITYVEAHGTATPLGDPVEVAALTRAFDTDARGFCALGSVKTNVGHLDAAAGVAGLIKTVLALEHGEIPPSLNFERPNPAIDFAGSPFFVADRLRPWTPPEGVPRRAGVSSFGIGGTNAHVVLEEAPRPAALPTDPRPELLVLSARTPEALEELGASLAARLESAPGPALADVAFTLQRGRRTFPHRRALVASTQAEAAALLRGGDPAQVATRRAADSDPGVVFLFSGLGSQYAGMARGLYETEPAFREAMDRCFAVLRDGWGMDLRSVLFSDAPVARPAGGMDLRAMLRGPAARSEGDPLQGARWGHPAMFSVGWALAETWRSRGITPRAVAGHSLGEYVAACVAGVFTLEDALGLVVRRAELLEPVRGSMAAATLSEAETRALVDEIAADGAQLWLAAVNAPRSCVVSGTEDAVERFGARARALGAVVLPMAVRHPFHSGLLEPVRDDFARIVAETRRSAPRIPLAANATGDWLRADQAASVEYWTEHLLAPVRFSECVERLRSMDDGEPVMLELGPGSTLGSWARQGGAERVAPSLRHAEQGDDDAAVLLRALGQLWSWGVAVDWRKQGGAEGRTRVPLPGHPMNRRRFWLADPVEGAPAVSSVEPEDRNGAAQVEAVLWRQLPGVEPGTADAFRGRRVVAFAGADASAFVERLRAGGAEVVRVEAGEWFADEGGRVAVRPDEPEDFARLAASLRTRGWDGPVDTLHLWSLDDAAATAGGASVLHWVRSLSESRFSTDGSTLLAATRGAHVVLGSEEPRPRQAAVAASVLDAAGEHPGIRVRSVDVDARGWEAAVLDEAAALLRGGGGPTTVARRGRVRWEPFRSPVESGGSRLREGGVHLVVGGVEGVGLAVAGYLAEHARARLALVDTSADAGDETRRAFAVGALSSLGGEVEIVNADPTDPHALRRAATEARARFGALHGAVVADGGAAAALALDAALGDDALDLLALFAPPGGDAAARADAAVLHAMAAERTLVRGQPTVAVAWEGGGAGGDAPLAGISGPEAAEVLGRVFARGGGPAVVVTIASRAGPGETATGGDRAAYARPRLATEYVEPRTELEETVARLYGRALGIDRVGAEDDFWELGGDSLLATQLLAALNERYGVELPLATLFEAVTPARLAVAVVKKQAEQLDADLLARALAEL